MENLQNIDTQKMRVLELIPFKITLILIGLSFLCFHSTAQDKEDLKPHIKNVKYGEYERNVLDIWIADSTQVSPLVIYIHGGGFVGGSKNKINRNVVNKFLSSGISVAALNYRFIKQAYLPAAHHDVLKALQFLRLNAEKWNINKKKIGAFGGSAGAQLCMWLAFSDDMAEPDSEIPIERESSRLTAIATSGGQTTMNMDLWRDWIPEFTKYGTPQDQFFGVQTIQERAELIRKISAYTLVSSDDPPIFMKYGMSPEDAVPENPKKANGWKVHHVNFGIKLKEKMDSLGLESYLKFPGVNIKYNSQVDFLTSKLLKDL